MLLDALVQFVATVLVVFSLILTCLVLLSVQPPPRRRHLDDRRRRYSGNARG
jgi:hypothetical protein